jgi:hypothetical protein
MDHSTATLVHDDNFDGVIGSLPISIIAVGLVVVSSLSPLLKPPARMTAFIQQSSA